MKENKRFIVSIDNKNGVRLYDGDIQLLYFQFNNIQYATECKDALKHQCSLMNELHEENKELKEKVKQLQRRIDTQKLINESLRINEECNKKAIQKLTVQRIENKKWVNDKISDLEKKYEFGQTEYKGCPMHNIQFGINILKELQEHWEKQEND